MQELLDATLDDKVNDGSRCTECNNPYKSCRQINRSSKYLVLLVSPNRSTQNNITKKEPTPIKEIPSKSVTFCGKTYKFNCMISHWGEFDTAHYVAWIKKQRWVLINDKLVTNNLKWPKNAYSPEGNKCAYLLFYSS